MESVRETIKVDEESPRKIESEKPTQIFKNKIPFQRAGCCSKLFFSWVNPLINYSNKHKKISIEQLGDLRQCDEVEAHTERLNKIWDRYKTRGSNNKLFKAVIRLFLGEYLLVMLFNFIQTLITILTPYLVKYLIDFIKTGENPWAHIFDFWDTSKVSWLSWMTRDLQYGVAMVLVLNLSKLIAFFINEQLYFY